MFQALEVQYAFHPADFVCSYVVSKFVLFKCESVSASVFLCIQLSFCVYIFTALLICNSTLQSTSLFKVDNLV